MCRFVHLTVLLGLVAFALVSCSDDAALQSAQAEIAKGNATIASLNADVASLNSELGTANETIAEQQSAIAEQQSAISEWEAANAALATNLDDALGAVDDWEAALADKENELVSAMQAHASSIANAVNERDVVQDRLDVVMERLAATEDALNKLRAGSAAAIAAEGKVESLQASAAELEAQIADLKGGIARLTGEYNRYQALLEEHCTTRNDRPLYRNTTLIDPGIITGDDPTSLRGVEYAGRGERTIYDYRPGRWITVNVYLFVARYPGTEIEFQVNPEFGGVAAAQAEVEVYASAIGRLPAFLLERAEHAYINDGRGNFGGNWAARSFIIHTENGEDFIRHGTLEEVFIHEGVHISLDGPHRNSEEWRMAQLLDCAFISRYAMNNSGGEDFAESFVAYYALRYAPERLSDGDRQAILNAIPNRIAYFDEQGLGPEQ